MRHIAPRHTLEVVLEVILEHVLRIKTMTSLILDHVVIDYLYLGTYKRESHDLIRSDSIKIVPRIIMVK